MLEILKFVTKTHWVAVICYLNGSGGERSDKPWSQTREGTDVICLSLSEGDMSFECPAAKM